MQKALYVREMGELLWGVFAEGLCMRTHGLHARSHAWITVGISASNESVVECATSIGKEMHAE